MNRPLALLGAALCYVGMKLTERSVSIRPVPMKERKQSNWLVEWRRRRLKATA